MAFVISQNYKHMPTQEEVQMKNGMTAVLNDLAAIRAAFLALTAKLDIDTGVNSTNYASTLNPAALELEA